MPLRQPYNLLWDGEQVVPLQTGRSEARAKRHLSTYQSFILNLSIRYIAFSLEKKKKWKARVKIKLLLIFFLLENWTKLPSVNRKTRQGEQEVDKDSFLAWPNFCPASEPSPKPICPLPCKILLERTLLNQFNQNPPTVDIWSDSSCFTILQVMSDYLGLSSAKNFVRLFRQNCMCSNVSP